MPNLLSQLTKGEQARLLEELNYMNLEEIHGFCSGHGIPFKVIAEHSDGSAKATGIPIESRSCWRASAAT